MPPRIQSLTSCSKVQGQFPTWTLKCVPLVLTMAPGPGPIPATAEKIKAGTVRREGLGDKLPLSSWWVESESSPQAVGQLLSPSGQGPRKELAYLWLALQPLLTSLPFHSIPTLQLTSVFHKGNTPGQCQQMSPRRLQAHILVRTGASAPASEVRHAPSAYLLTRSNLWAPHSATHIVFCAVS